MLPLLVDAYVPRLLGRSPLALLSAPLLDGRKELAERATDPLGEIGERLVAGEASVAGGGRPDTAIVDGMYSRRWRDG